MASVRSNFTHILLLALVAFVFPACSDDDPTGPGSTTGPGGVTISDLAGTWNATSFTFTPAAGGTAFDLIGQGGSLVLGIQANGDITIAQTEPGGAPEVLNGTMLFDPTDVNFILLQIDGETGTDRLRITLTGTTAMTLFEADSEFDFDDNGTDDPATLEIVLVKA